MCKAVIREPFELHEPSLPFSSSSHSLAVLHHTGGRGSSRYWIEPVVLIKKSHFTMEVLFQMCSVPTLPRVNLENTVSVERRSWNCRTGLLHLLFRVVLTQAAVWVSPIFQFTGMSRTHGPSAPAICSSALPWGGDMGCGSQRSPEPL